MLLPLRWLLVSLLFCPAAVRLPRLALTGNRRSAVPILLRARRRAVLMLRTLTVLLMFLLRMLFHRLERTSAGHGKILVLRERRASIILKLAFLVTPGWRELSWTIL